MMLSIGSIMSYFITVLLATTIGTVLLLILNVACGKSKKSKPKARMPPTSTMPTTTSTLPTTTSTSTQSPTPNQSYHHQAIRRVPPTSRRYPPGTSRPKYANKYMIAARHTRQEETTSNTLKGTFTDTNSEPIQPRKQRPKTPPETETESERCQPRRPPTPKRSEQQPHRPIHKSHQRERSPLKTNVKVKQGTKVEGSKEKTGGTRIAPKKQTEALNTDTRSDRPAPVPLSRRHKHYEHDLDHDYDQETQYEKDTPIPVEEGTQMDLDADSPVPLKQKPRPRTAPTAHVPKSGRQKNKAAKVPETTMSKTDDPFKLETPMSLFKYNDDDGGNQECTDPDTFSTLAIEGSKESGFVARTPNKVLNQMKALAGQIDKLASDMTEDNNKRMKTKASQQIGHVNHKQRDQGQGQGQGDHNKPSRHCHSRRRHSKRHNESSRERHRRKTDQNITQTTNTPSAEQCI